MCNTLDDCFIQIQKMINIGYDFKVFKGIKI